MRVAAQAGPRRGLTRRLADVMRRPAPVSFGAGAATALALPPFGLWPLLVGFAVLALLLRREESGRGTFLLGWCFGFGHFLVGLYWVAIAFFTDVERYGALAVPAVLLLCAGLALLPALTILALRLRAWSSPTAFALALALAWGGAEWLRSLIFGGFPWNLVGYVWIDTPAAQLASVVSVYGLSLLGVALGALPLALLEPGGRSRWVPVAAGLAGLAVVWGWGAARLGGAEPQSVDDVRLRLVQGNVAQHHKWDPGLRAQWFRRHLELSATGADGITHVIWPESAAPYPLEHDPTARALIGEIAPEGGYVLTGGERFDLEGDPPKAWNSLFVIDGEGVLRGRYDKRELVPFGEYLPFRALLGQLGLGTLTRGTIDFHPGPGPATLELPGLPPFSPLICYEVIFPGVVVEAGARPGWLLNVTNDAWFGRSSGPYQHLAMARMRSIEQGLPLVRSANTGISAVIDPWGREQAKMELGEMGALDSDLPQALPPTPFARYGLWPLALLALALAGGAFGIEVRARDPRSKVNKSSKPGTN